MFLALARAFRTLLVASAFFFFWAGGVVLAWTLCPALALFCRDESRRWGICQRIVSRAFRLFHAYMRVLRLLEVKLDEPSTAGFEARPPGPLVVVANHPTLVDVTAILCSYDDRCCVVKASLMDNVFIGRLLRMCGHLRGGPEAMAGAALMEEARRRFEAGFAVLVFPEGTRSPPGQLHPFRRGAFELAKRAGVPVWPLHLTCHPLALSKGLPFWKQPDRCACLRIHPGKVLPAPTNARETRRNVEGAVRARLDLPALPAPPEVLQAGFSAPAVAVSPSGSLPVPRDEAPHSA